MQVAIQDPRKNTKHDIPDIHMPRYTLLKKLISYENKRVVFMSAPSGYGKTILTRLWLKKSLLNPIWINLSKDDNNPTAFYHLVCKEIASVQQDNLKVQEVLNSRTFGASPVEHTIMLLSHFYSRRKRYAIILDDMHLITNEEIRSSLLEVQKVLSPKLMGIVITQNRISQNDIDVIGKDRCTVFTIDDMKFTEREIVNYFKQHGSNITEIEGRVLRKHTNNWAIGINMSLNKDMWEKDIKKALVYKKYIETDIWGKLNDDEKDFLLKTSIVADVSVELGNILTNRNNSKDILENLLSKIPTLVRTSDGTYRFHSTFLNFIGEKYDSLDEDIKRSLYLKLSGYYLQRNEIYPARQYAVKSRESNMIIKTNFAMQESDHSDLLIEEFVNINRSFFTESDVDTVCKSHPYLYSQYAGFYFLTGDAKMMEHCMDKLYKALPLIALRHTKFLADDLLITFIDSRKNMSGVLNFFSKFPKLPSLKGRMDWSSITMHMPHFHKAARNLCEFADEKNLTNAANVLLPVMGDRGNILVKLIRSGIRYEQNELSNSLELLSGSDHMIMEEKSGEVIFCAFMLKASIYLTTGDEMNLHDVLRQTDEYMKDSGNIYFKPNFESFKTRISLIDADKRAARNWLANYFVVHVSEGEDFDLYKLHQYFTTARAYMVLGEVNKARSYILRLKKLCTAFHRQIDTAEANVLLACLEWALGNENEALSILAETIISIQPYNFIRVIANESEAILPVLKKLTIHIDKGIKIKDSDVDINDIDSKFLYFITLSTYEYSKKHKGIAAHIFSKKTKLAKQQKNVLTLLAQGYKNGEIADMTGLTKHTVKFHLAKAYKKLGVDNAMDAVLKAKEREWI